MPETPLPFFTRLWLAWAVYFRVLFDGAFAARVRAAAEGAPELPPAKAEPPRESPKAASSSEGALQLLAILQREGRLVDFLQQEITTFKDDEVGAAARVVHDGCKKAIDALVKLEPVRAEEEGAKVVLEAGFIPAEVKLSGNVGGSAPYRGVLRHRGWRARELSLPTPVKGRDARIVAPAEVEL